MASSPSAASRARLFSELSRSRASSPIDDNIFTTATAMSFRDALHSTPQRQDHTATHRLSANHNHTFGDDSTNSEDMSIEIGRGGKRTTYARDDEMSSHALFNFGDDNSQYEVTATPPPAKSRQGQQRKLDGSLRKTASLRRALSTSKSNLGQDALGHAAVANGTSALPAVNRPSRFASTRNVSSEFNSQGIPSRFSSAEGLYNTQSNLPQTAIQNNVTIHSTSYTANQSFMLPDLPDLTEIVAGVRKDGTPVINRAAKTRSRFTSAAYNPPPHAYVPIESLAVPEDEKAIFASLQLLKDRVSQLEAENSEAKRRAEEYVGEIIGLRNQLNEGSRRQDSAIGSDDETNARHHPGSEIPKLEANVKLLQERCQRAERKASVAEITVKRVTNERDALMTQIGKAYFGNEELVKENEELRDRQDQTEAENDYLKTEVERLKSTLARLELKIQQQDQRAVAEAVKLASTIPAGQDATAKNGYDTTATAANPVAKSRKRAESTSADAGVTKGRSLQGLAGLTEDLATRIEQEIQNYREQAAARNSRHSREQLPAAPTMRTRSKSQRRQERAVSAPNPETTATLNLTHGSQRTRKSQPKMSEEQTENLTMLSDWRTDEIIDLAKMRKKLEEEMRNERAKKRAPATIQPNEDSVRSLPSRIRKSSLKDLSTRYNENTGHLSVNGDITSDPNRTSRTVRVQSPHSSDAVSAIVHGEDYTDASAELHSIGRHRRVTESDGDTSAFIVPDITLRSVHALPAALVKACIQHETANCTACAGSDAEKTVPTPIPVTDRDVDVTNATIRPSQSPETALATVIKHLEDEITHLKIQREAQNRLYNQHDPALSKRRRVDIKSKLERLTAEIEKRSDQVYALYDVLEGQKQQHEQTDAAPSAHGQVNVEDLNDIDPAEVSGRIGRSAPATGLDGIDEFSDGELPWEGISDIDDEEH